MSPSDKHKVDFAWNNCFRKVFNACWRESVKPLLFYCNTMPASLPQGRTTTNVSGQLKI